MDFWGYNIMYLPAYNTAGEDLDVRHPGNQNITNVGTQKVCV